MATEFWARLEDPSGRYIGPDPAWTPQRQFLWDVVHDTRGLLRESAEQEELDYIRRIDRAPGIQAGFALDPVRVRRTYEAIRARAREHDVRFRLVAPEGTDAFAAVCFFEQNGAEYALVGGWTGPVLRTIAPEPDLQPLASDATEATVGARRFMIRAVPYDEYFRDDFDALLALLHSAESKGLRVRFLQR